MQQGREGSFEWGFWYNAGTGYANILPLIRITEATAMELTQEYLKSILHYDPDTGVFTWRNTRNGTKAGRRAGHTMKDGYGRNKLNGKHYLGHRLACLYMTGAWPENEVDHINGIRGDNSWANLRHVTPKQNSKNKKMPNTNSSGVMGVSWNKSANKWEPRIQVAGKAMYLGRFTHIEQALAARKEAEVKYGFHPNHGR